MKVFTTKISGFGITVTIRGARRTAVVTSSPGIEAPWEEVCECGGVPYTSGGGNPALVLIHTATLLEIRDWLKDHDYPTQWTPDQPDSV